MATINRYAEAVGAVIRYSVDQFGDQPNSSAAMSTPPGGIAVGA